MKQKYVFLIAFLLLIAIPTAAYFIFFKKTNNDPATANILDTINLDSFAQYLAEKQITMYGADWCSYCQKEKNDFGDSFKYVPYVECPDEPQVCLEKGVDGYPTWIFPDGKKLVGAQGILKLIQESGYPLPAQSQ